MADQTSEPLDLLGGNIPWPRKGVPFWGNDDTKRTQAHIDWIRDLGYDLAEAFKSAADFSVEELKRGGDGTHPDRFALPILYLYRHAIELQLKDIVQLAVRIGLLDNSKRLEELYSGSHDLRRLWANARKAMEAFWPEGDRAELQVVEAYITEVSEIDPDGQRFRYDNFSDQRKDDNESSQEKKAKKLAAVQTLPEQFGLQYLASRVDEVFRLLNGTEDAFIDAWDHLRAAGA